jgi:ketol-acid reductoisomerase
MVAPKATRAFGTPYYEAEGEGVPALFAVYQDAHRVSTIAPWHMRVLSILRAGVLETSFREETETDLSGEQVVLCK